jgi:cytochrome c oxidase subunit 2
MLALEFFPKQASSVAGRVDALFFFLTGVSLFFSVIIFVLLLFFAVKYRRRSESEMPQPSTGSNQLELAWTVMPLGIAMVMFGWGAHLYFHIRRPPLAAMDIYVVARQWMWKFQHVEGHQEINELHLPVGQAVKLTMSSEDVIHSLFVPAFRTKQDVLPGRYVTMWFMPTRPGEYHLFCSQYCGAKHAGMIGRVVVMEPLAYENWLSRGGGEGSMAERGAKLFLQFGCNTCHRAGPVIQTGTAASRGPDLTGLFGKNVQLTDGTTRVADEAYLRESILRPAAKIVMGYQNIMPSFQGQLSETAVMQLDEYIKSLVIEEPRQPRQ